MGEGATTCTHCGISFEQADEQIQKLDQDFCKECAERICLDCGVYIDDLDKRQVVHGTIRCEECTWCYLGDLCCGCGTDVADSTEMVMVNGSHQFCADCKGELPDDAHVEEYPFRKELDEEPEQDAPF